MTHRINAVVAYEYRPGHTFKVIGKCRNSWNGRYYYDIKNRETGEEITGCRDKSIMGRKDRMFEAFANSERTEG